MAKQTNKPLSAQQRRFADLVLDGKHLQKAYMEAFGVSASVAAPGSNRLMKNPKVKDYIKASQEKLIEKVNIPRERVAQEYARIAFGDARMVMEWGDGWVKLIPSEQLSKDAAALVESITLTHTDSGTNMKLKMHSKIGALDGLARILGLNQVPLMNAKDEEGKRIPIKLVLEPSTRPLVDDIGYPIDTEATEDTGQ